MTVGLEGPAPYYQPPGEDTQPMTLAEYLRGALALIAQDRVLAPDEMQEIQLFMAGVQEIGQQRMATAAPEVAPGEGLFQPGQEEDFAAGAGEPVEGGELETEEPF